MEEDDAYIKLAANGQWQMLIGPITGLSVFEIIAHAKGEKEKGKYAVLHAIATNAFGSGKIKNTKVNFGPRWNRLSLRWQRNNTSEANYSLQIKTHSNYGSEGIIFVKMNELLKSDQSQT